MPTLHQQGKTIERCPHHDCLEPDSRCTCHDADNQKGPKPYIDPTFTPLRDEKGGFQKVQEPPAQKKLDPSDPDWDKINPDIIALAQRNGMARSALNLYLEGELNWTHALETMVTALGRELLVNQKILVEVRHDYVDLFNIQQAQTELEDRSEEAQRKLQNSILAIEEGPKKCKCGNDAAPHCLKCFPCLSRENPGNSHDVAN